MSPQTCARILTAPCRSASIVACGDLGCQPFFAGPMASTLALSLSIDSIPYEGTKVSPISLLLQHLVILARLALELRS